MLSPVLLGRDGGIILCDWNTDSAITGIGMGIASLLTSVSGLSEEFTTLSTPCTFGNWFPPALILDLVTTY